MHPCIPRSHNILFVGLIHQMLEKSNSPEHSLVNYQAYAPAIKRSWIVTLRTYLFIKYIADNSDVRWNESGLLTVNFKVWSSREAAQISNHHGDDPAWQSPSQAASTCRLCTSSQPLHLPLQPSRKSGIYTPFIYTLFLSFKQTISSCYELLLTCNIVSHLHEVENG